MQVISSGARSECQRMVSFGQIECSAKYTCIFQIRVATVPDTRRQELEIMKNKISSSGFDLTTLRLSCFLLSNEATEAMQVVK